MLRAHIKAAIIAAFASAYSQDLPTAGDGEEAAEVVVTGFRASLNAGVPGRTPGSGAFLAVIPDTEM